MNELKQNYYQILELQQQATKMEIKKAYRSKAKLHHPDKKKDDLSLEMQRLNEAYEVLSHPKKRVKYDLILADRLELQKRENFKEKVVGRGLTSLGLALLSFVVYRLMAKD